MNTSLIDLAERGLLPDALIRFGIRRLHGQRLRAEQPRWQSDREAAMAHLQSQLAGGAIAIHTDDANEQHYEVPTPFFQHVLGPRLKYSSCLYPSGVDALADAEERMLHLTCDRAELADGQEILELGCGWGSLTLFLAEQYPRARILAVSNSSTQKAYIEGQAAQRGLDNVEVRTADVAAFEPEGLFDRVVSVEMFEHMRNYRRLMDRIDSWLRPGGKLFVHIFCHREYAYLYEDRGPGDWMTRHFFSGGTMPSYDLLPRFRGALRLEDQWRINGTHYARTLEAWLRRMDAQRAKIAPLFNTTYGPEHCRRWMQRWRIFFMACAELFQYRDGEEWFVAHYRFAKG